MSLTYDVVSCEKTGPDLKQYPPLQFYIYSLRKPVVFPYAVQKLFVALTYSKGS